MLGIPDDWLITISLLALTGVTYRILLHIDELGGDLRATIYLLALAITSHVVPSTHILGQIVKVVFGLPLFFYIPGYAFVSALFPKREKLSWIERFTMGVGMSIAIAVFSGFALSVSPWLYRPNPILVSLSLITLVFLLIAQYLRSRVPVGERFTFSFRETFSPLFEGDLFAGEKQFFLWLFSHLFRLKKKSAKPEIGIEETLVLTMIACIIVAGSMFAYGFITQEKEKFTALYILGPGKKAEYYPIDVYFGEVNSILVGVENYEHAKISYTLQVKLGGEVVASRDIILEHNGKWLEEVSFTPKEISLVKTKLEFLLYKDNPFIPYRSVHLWVNSSYRLDFLKANFNFIKPEVENGNFEDSASWVFSSNNKLFNGSYSRSERTSPNHSYEISYPPYNDSFAGAYAALTQNILSSSGGIGVLSLAVKDSYSSDRQEGIYFKQVLVNDKLVWEDDLAGDEGWVYIRIPVILKEGGNSLTLRVYDKKGFERNQTPEYSGNGFKVWWDDVRFIDLSQAVEREEAVIYNADLEPPISRVLPLKRYINTTNFLVEWEGEDVISGVAYYDVEYSIDGVNWIAWQVNTIVNSSWFYGSDQTTYYFRCRAMDKAGNVEGIHGQADAITTIDIKPPSLGIVVTKDRVNSTFEIIVISDEPLDMLTCGVFPFGNESRFVSMSSMDNLTWSGIYYAPYITNYEIKVTGRDLAGNYRMLTYTTEAW